MIQEKLVEEMVREVLKSLQSQGQQAAVSDGSKLNADRDYPLAAKRPELVKTPTNKSLSDISLEKAVKGEVKAEDVRITPETLRLQGEIADSIGRNQFANNLKRAAELTAIPDERILEIYNALRPYRSTKQQLLEIADEMQNKYKANVSAAFVREAAEVYERRNRLKAN